MEGGGAAPPAAALTLDGALAAARSMAEQPGGSARLIGASDNELVDAVLSGTMPQEEESASFCPPSPLGSYAPLSGDGDSGRKLAHGALLPLAPEGLRPHSRKARIARTEHWLASGASGQVRTGVVVL